MPFHMAWTEVFLRRVALPSNKEELVRGVSQMRQIHYMQPLAKLRLLQQSLPGNGEPRATNSNSV